MAKGLGGGFQPIGATLGGKKVVDAVEQGSGHLKHGFTYMGHSVACAASLEVFRIVKEQNLLEAVQVRGAQLRDELQRTLGDHPNVGDIRGRGLFIGVELVADTETKEAFNPAVKLHARIRDAAFKNGLLIYPNGGTVDGSRGDHVLFAPAYTVSASEISEIVLRFRKSLDLAINQ
ncbi:Adenosylmethionine-8-amino-7-oxononanoate aminotransferase [compost metagenome]